MSVKVSAWVWEHSKTTGNDRLLLLAIADCADDDGDNAWPSVDTLAEKATCSERTVQRRIQHLEEVGCLTVLRGAGRNGTHRYRVHMDKGAMKPPKPKRASTPAGEKAVDNPQGGDKLSPPEGRPQGGDKLSPGVTQLCRVRGDTQVSPERPERPSTPPTPRASRGAKCPHGRSTNCRACGTNPRVRGTNPRTADADLVRRRAAVPWCGGHHCDRRTRRVFDADTGHFTGQCPDCNPDVIVGPAPPQLALAR